LKNEKDFELYMRTKAGNDSISIKEAMYQLIKPQTADSLANIFNKSLIKNTKDYLIKLKDTTNITVLKSELKEPDNMGSFSLFKIKYDMLEASDEKKPNGASKELN
jgi:hypothetical protein